MGPRHWRLGALLVAWVSLSCGGDAGDPTPLPALARSAPESGATDVPVTGWIVLDFEAAAPASVDSFRLDCDGEVALTVSQVSDTRLVVNPRGELPADESCALAWEGPGGSLRFRTAAAGEPAVI